MYFAGVVWLGGISSIQEKCYGAESLQLAIAAHCAVHYQRAVSTLLLLQCCKSSHALLQVLLSLWFTHWVGGLVLAT